MTFAHTMSSYMPTTTQNCYATAPASTSRLSMRGHVFGERTPTRLQRRLFVVRTRPTGVRKLKGVRSSPRVRAYATSGTLAHLRGLAQARYSRPVLRAPWHTKRWVGAVPLQVESRWRLRCRPANSSRPTASGASTTRTLIALNVALARCTTC